MAEIKMSKEERVRGARKTVEMYHRMNLEPISGEAIKEEYRKWERKLWRKEKEVERHQREKKEKEMKKKEEERTEKEEDWRASDRKKVWGFLQRQKEEEEETRRYMEAKRRSEFIKMVTSEYKDVTFN